MSSSGHPGRRLAVAAAALLCFVLAAPPSTVSVLSTWTGSAGPSVCRMACAGTAECCCRPRRPPARDEGLEPAPSVRGDTDRCPPYCAVLGGLVLNSSAKLALAHVSAVEAAATGSRLAAGESRGPSGYRHLDVRSRAPPARAARPLRS